MVVYPLVMAYITMENDNRNSLYTVVGQGYRWLLYVILLLSNPSTMKHLLSMDLNGPLIVVQFPNRKTISFGDVEHWADGLCLGK